MDNGWRAVPLDEKENFLWYGIGEYDQYNLAQNGIGRFNTDVMEKSDINRYKKYSLLTPDFKKALSAATKAALKGKERLILVLCSVSPTLMSSVEGGIVKDIPLITEKEKDGNKIVAVFWSKEPNSGVLNPAYVFSQTRGIYTYRKVFLEAAAKDKIRVELLSPPKPTFEWIPKVE